VDSKMLLLLLPTSSCLSAAACCVISSTYSCSGYQKIINQSTIAAFCENPCCGSRSAWIRINFGSPKSGSESGSGYGDPGARKLNQKLT
jgi:hypothetical protein